MRSLTRFLFLALLIIGLLTLWEYLRQWSVFSRFTLGSQTTQQVVLKEVTALGKLELVRYTFRDIVEHNQARAILPNARAVLIVQGEATGCIDLTHLTAADVQTGDTIVVKLPKPELCGWKINHKQSKVYDTQFGFMDESELVSGAYTQAEEQIRQSALNSGILEQTRQNADRILRPILEKVSGKPVKFRY
jgi:hypothetical protein